MLFKDSNVFSKAVDRVFGYPQDKKLRMATAITVSKTITPRVTVYRFCGTAKCGQLP